MFPRSSFAARGIASSAQPPSCPQVPSPSVEEWLGIALTPLLFSAAQLLFASEAPAVAATAAEGAFVAAFAAPQVSLRLSSIYRRLLVAFFAHQFSFTLLRLQVVSFAQRGHLVSFVQQGHLVSFVLRELPIFITRQLLLTFFIREELPVTFVPP